jgi:predicted MFS family arabinose efflux permease
MPFMVGIPCGKLVGNLIDWAQSFAANKPSFELALIGRWPQYKRLDF